MCVCLCKSVGVSEWERACELLLIRCRVCTQQHNNHLEWIGAIHSVNNKIKMKKKPQSNCSFCTRYYAFSEMNIFWLVFISKPASTAQYCKVKKNKPPSSQGFMVKSYWKHWSHPNHRNLATIIPLNAYMSNHLITAFTLRFVF